MNYPKHVVIGFLQVIILFGDGISLTSSQRTTARQGSSREPPTVTIPGQGILMGKEILLARPQKVTTYLGVPYARPPIGQLRFAAPVTPPESWSDTRNATQFAPSCLQVAGERKLHEKLFRELLSADWMDPGYSEDCLYLNLYIPDGQPPSEGWPVMVWFHGGDFNTGTPAITDATVFVNKQKILVVTVAYRLNIFGFFTTADAEAPGNYGMLDQVAALEWVQTNIGYFDGSPKNVVIAGHSSGAISVGLHIVSSLSKGKFAKAIAMSGDAIGVIQTPELELPIIDSVADRFGCFKKPRSDLVQCLRRIPANSLLKDTADIETWGPIIDADTNNTTEPFLRMNPKDILESGEFNAAPLMAGYTSNEQVLAYMETSDTKEDDGKLSPAKFESLITDEVTAALRILADNTSTCEIKPHVVSDAVLFLYTPYPPSSDSALLRDRYLAMQTEKNYAAGLIMLASKVSQKAKTFVYRFDYRLRTTAIVQNIPAWAGVPHMFELPFVWGLPHVFPSTIQWVNSDKNLADVMMMLIGNFIRLENPSLINVRWSGFTEQTPGILIIDRMINMSDVNAIDYRALAFWNEYYPILKDEALNSCCNSTYSDASTIVFNSGLFITSFFLITKLIPLIHV